jgi:FMN-dependent NADH-azoreductase
MARLLHLDSSARVDGSRSREVALAFRSSWERSHPEGEVVYRDLASDPLPHLVDAVRAAGVDAAEQTEDQRAALALQDRVIEEFLAADAYVLSVPMYNFGIPSQLKAYLDHLLLVGRVIMLDGSPSPVAGRTATVVVSFGGGYGPGTPRESFDFVRPYLTKVLEETLGLQVELISVELTLASSVPAMAGLVPLAEQSHEQALTRADERARSAVDLLAG